MNLNKIDLRPIEKIFKKLNDPLKSKKRVLIVRHGQSEGNVKPIYYGSSDYPLTHIGKAQAKILSPIFKKYLPSFDAFASSNLNRALETYRECLYGGVNEGSFSFNNLTIRNSDNYMEHHELKLMENIKVTNVDSEFVDFIPIPSNEQLSQILGNESYSDFILDDTNNVKSHDKSMSIYIK